jgi:hypothetical protein
MSIRLTKFDIFFLRSLGITAEPSAPETPEIQVPARISLPEVMTGREERLSLVDVIVEIVRGGGLTDDQMRVIENILDEDE